MYNFGDIIGNEKNITYLKKLIEKKHIGHAYTISGVGGSGKKILAYSFAKTLLCEHYTGCNTCLSCKTFDSGNNPDIAYINKLSVDDIREQVNKSVHVKPYFAKHKIYIIHDADKMNVSAQNAILKTLEEPPEYAIIILIATNTNKLLKTVLSRVTLLKTSVLSDEQVKMYLQSQENIDNISMASVFSMGSIGRALNIASDSSFIENINNIIDIALAIRQSNLVELFGLYKKWETMKENIDECLDILYIWYRDILIAKKNLGETLIQNENIRLEAENYTYDGLINILQEIQSTKRNISFNANFQLSMEMLMVKLKENITS